MKQLGNTFIEFLEQLPSELTDYFKSEIELMDLSTEDLDSDMEGMLGGYYYLVESVNDLKEIKTYHSSLYDSSDVFDVCTLIVDDKFAQVGNMTNNSGGPVFLIPEKFFTNNVIDSVRKTSEDHA